MSGPERLEDDARPARRRTWVVVAVALVAVAGLGAVRLTGIAHDLVPPTMPDPSASGEATTTWPQGLPAGTLYALDDNGVEMVDVRTGAVRRSSLGSGTFEPTLTSAPGGVLVWSRDEQGPTHLVDVALPDPVRVEGVLAQAHQFLPGDDLSTWTTTTGAETPSRVTTWRLVDTNLRVRRELRLRGTTIGDGSGGLLELGADDAVRHLRPGAPVQAWRGTVLAVGEDGFETLRCADGRCRLVVLDPTGRHETPARGSFGADLAVGALSRGNRFAAAVESASATDDGSVVVRVLDVVTGRELRDFPVVAGGYGMTWITDRWLAANSTHGLVLYDAVEDRLFSPRTPLVDIGVLVFQRERER